MDNNIQKYMAFVKTVETGSFTKAATMLNYSQSSVSKMIQDLEKQWNLTLLERDRNGVHLTGNGEELLFYARNLVDDYNKLIERVNELKGVQTGVIRIGTFSSIAINYLPDIFARFQVAYPRIEYEMLLGDYEEIENWLEQGRVDLGFLSLPTKNKLDSIFLKLDEYMVILPKNHPLANKNTINIKDLEEEPFMLLEHGGRTEVSELLEKSGVNLNIKFTTWEDFAIMAMVEKGLGVSILPKLILQKIPYKIAMRPLEAPFYREIGIAVKNKKRISPVTKRFIDFLIEENEINKKDFKKNDFFN